MYCMSVGSPGILLFAFIKADFHFSREANFSFGTIHKIRDALGGGGCLTFSHKNDTRGAGLYKATSRDAESEI